MKKTFFAAAALSLGITASACAAAHSFSDVPATH